MQNFVTGLLGFLLTIRGMPSPASEKNGNLEDVVRARP
jgi:hypothetical protein